MKVVLYLFMANFGCNYAKDYIIERNYKVSGMCCSLDDSGCMTEKQLADASDTP